MPEKPPKKSGERKSEPSAPVKKTPDAKATPIAIKPIEKLTDLESGLTMRLQADTAFSTAFREVVFTPAVLKNVVFEPDYARLQNQLAQLRADVTSKVRALSQEVDAEEKEEQIAELEGKVDDLLNKEKLSHLLSRVGKPARRRLLSDEGFRAEFSRDQPCNAFVLSIDIRRSTELMLKARDPKLFARFISELALQLRDTVIDNFGIFDKFTGDGILAFYPDFYSGCDAGFRAVKSAIDCHSLFHSHFEQNRKCFLSVLKDIGLGIGLDYGQVQLVEIGGDLTVVGTPVVYACRMAGAPAGLTFANQPAYETLFSRYAVFDFEETYVEFKHEGKTLAYAIRANGKKYEPQDPDWVAPQTPGTPSAPSPGSS